MKNRFNRLIIAMATILLLSTVLAMAQSQPPLPQQDARQENQNFDRQTLEKYAAASIELRKIQQEFAQKLKNVEDQEKAMKIEQEAARLRISAVEDHGLDVRTYNNIANQLHIDPKLRKEIEQIIEAIGG